MADSNEAEPVVVHPRDVACDGAAREIVEWSEAWRKRWELTDIETTHILLQLARVRLRVMGLEERQLLIAREQREAEAKNVG